MIASSLPLQPLLQTMSERWWDFVAEEARIACNPRPLALPSLVPCSQQWSTPLTFGVKVLTLALTPDSSLFQALL